MEKKLNKKLIRGIIKRALTVFVFVFLQAVVFFACAGRTDLPRAWLYFGLTVLQLLCNMVVLLKYSPETIAERSELKSGTKDWDLVFAVLYSLMIVLLIPAIAGLDVGRFHWSQLGIEFAAFGTVLFVLSMSFVVWSMIENKFFELGVRVQKERKQYVVSTGPYAIVRHPGYAGMIVMYIAGPLIIGSLYAIACSLVLLVLFVIRTELEDRTLQKELRGYKEYAKKTKYRLVPGIW